MRELEVYFNNNKIKNKQIMPLETVQMQPQIKFNLESNKFYTILMVDPDAPSKDNPIYKYVLHWLVYNNNEIAVNFMPPAPPSKSGLHRYYICLFEQPNKIRESIKKYPRHNFSVKDFVKQYNLNLVSCVMFKTESK